MLSEIQNTHVYTRALAATQIKPYKGLKLDHAVDAIGDALKLIHAQGFFIDYTRHGPEHSIELIKSLDWLISDDQRGSLTDADYLFLLLACALHDLGMLATKDEFFRRDKKLISEFEGDLKKTVHGSEFFGSIPKDYLHKEELIFEEFVRHHHAARIRSAILDSGDRKIGDVSHITKVIQSALHGLDQSCLSDLALICESHHKDDLHDLEKYQIKSVHGSDQQAQVNVQAVAILLRVADVLQIGTGRTPSIAFTILSPTNPISHLHWMKEMGVKRVEGSIVPAKTPEEREAKVVKIYGRFDEAEPFFALQNHLKFANSELQRCLKWTREAKASGQEYQFQWERIDGDKIDTHGFEREQFSFQIDREKILTLLVGHTLYNDTRVVLRELVQNSIDAVRLKEYRSEKATYRPQIRVDLDRNTRKLVISDNGTGMTGATIKSHLLTVGSSFYSTDEFEKQYPNFTPISRFGIGILTSFMIADEIEITTSHPDEPKARRININGPSGTYLIKLIEKNQLSSEFLDREHGTRIELTLRPKSRDLDVERELSHWFAFPACDLSAVVDSGSPKKIGFNHPTELLQEILDAVLAQQPNPSRYSDYEVVNCDVPGMYDGAYLVHRYRYSRRTFLARTDELPRRRVSERTERALRDCGIFLQGVRVVDGSPGFDSEGPVAVINGLGKGVPRTNVARSGIEQDTNHAAFFKSIYETYIKHAREEVSRWSAEAKSSSLTTRGRRISTSLRSIMTNSAPVHDKLLQQVLDEENRIVVEIGGERKLISINDMLRFNEFDTVESRFIGTAERLLENLSVSKSLRDITRALDLPDIGAQSEIILTEPSDNIDGRTLDSFSLGRVKFDEPSAQLSILWKRVAEDASPLKRLVPDLKRHGLGGGQPIVVVPREVLANESNWPAEAILVCEYATFVHPGNPEIEYFNYLHTDDVAEDERPDFKQAFIYALSQLWIYKDYDRGRPLEETASAFGRGDAEAMLADLKEKIVTFREMRVIKIGVEDELLW